MQQWAKRFARVLRAGDVVALVGPLGAGKTTLVQGVVRGLGSRRRAVSPTFALANEYGTRRGKVYHMDMYRLNARELAAFPLEDYWGDGICMIEWADRVRNRWPNDTLELKLSAPAPEVRRVTLGAAGHAWRDRLKSL